MWLSNYVNGKLKLLLILNILHKRKIILERISYLKDSEILENAVHHVLFWQVLQFMYEVDHIFAHGRTANTIDEPAIFEPSIFCLHFFHHLFPEGADFGRTCYRHVLVALVPIKNNFVNNFFWNIYQFENL